jgi:hypothetical protein
MHNHIDGSGSSCVPIDTNTASCVTKRYSIQYAINADTAAATTSITGCARLAIGTILSSA